MLDGLLLVDMFMCFLICFFDGHVLDVVLVVWTCWHLLSTSVHFVNPGIASQFSTQLIHNTICCSVCVWWRIYIYIYISSTYIHLCYEYYTWPGRFSCPGDGLWRVNCSAYHPQCPGAIAHTFAVLNSLTSRMNTSDMILPQSSTAQPTGTCYLQRQGCGKTDWCGPRK